MPELLDVDLEDEPIDPLAGDGLFVDNLEICEEVH